MSDFFQNGVVPTLHRLGRDDIAALEERLVIFARRHPISLVIPCLFSELEGPALPRIVQVLATNAWLGEVVIVLNRADRRDYEEARRFFAPLGPRGVLVWLESPKLQEFTRLLAEHELDLGGPGKGKACWFGLGCVLGGPRVHAIALHDADVVTYDRRMLARLCYPLLDPSLNYEYAKGYYGRVTDRLHGRVTRLFLTPLVRSLTAVAGPVPFLRYVDSFRYALAGEFALTEDLARSIRIPSDWGLEVGMLAEIYRNAATRRICQVDIAENYDHKHQQLSPGDAAAGLNRMSRDIAKALLRTIASEGVAFPAGFYTGLKATYLRYAQDAVRIYHDVAAINGLVFDRHSETLAIEVFTKALSRACEEFEADPLADSGLPDWNRVTSAIPGALTHLRELIDVPAR